MDQKELDWHLGLESRAEEEIQGGVNNTKYLLGSLSRNLSSIAEAWVWDC